MKHARIHIPSLSYIAAFVIGVILFAAFWKAWFGSATSVMILAGMAGVAVAVTTFWLRNEIQSRNKKEKQSWSRLKQILVQSRSSKPHVAGR